MFPKTSSSFKFSRTALVILFASLLLGILLSISTIRNLDREQSLMEDFLKREALTLIHSFEAGARTSRMHCRYGDDPLQTLVRETSRGNNIAYIRIVAENGRVAAEAGNLPETVTKSDITGILKSDSAQLTILQREAAIFEVASEFNPVHTGRRRKQKIMQCAESCCTPVAGNLSPNKRQVIYIGLNNDDFIQAQQDDIKHSLFMGLILFLLGSAGFYFIFLYQEMRVTKTTLADMELYAENVFNSMPTGLITVDRQGHLVSCNRLAEELTKIELAKSQGHNLNHLLPAWPESVTSGQSDLRNLQFTGTCKDGSQVPVKISSSRLRSSDGREHGRVLIFQDMSQIKDMEARLERSRRLAALGKMAAGIAHEIRNPLGTLKGFAQYFKDQAENDSESCEYADIMIGEVDRLNHIISALLQFARPREPEIKTVSARKILEQAVRLLTADFNKQAIEPKMISDENAEFQADPDLILQVLINLLKNSLAASGPGDNITLTAARDDNNITLTVKDSGKGMTPEEKERMFDPFFTTRKTGTGLGLAVSYQIIEQHNGRFEVESHLGKGTLIRIILPRKIQSAL